MCFRKNVHKHASFTTLSELNKVRMAVFSFTVRTFQNNQNNKLLHVCHLEVGIQYDIIRPKNQPDGTPRSRKNEKTKK